ncbi:unnamed protein product [Anisakis simplex]|uniref:MADF domain-containing protein n=1 Tax=Anisakis simplex TaxID=6269 RepID=A0A0M3K2A0_ANISI|nr:unnamed protein product [Anisakis simplex]
MLRCVSAAVGLRIASRHRESLSCRVGNRETSTKADNLEVANNSSVRKRQSVASQRDLFVTSDIPNKRVCKSAKSNSSPLTATIPSVVELKSEQVVTRSSSRLKSRSSTMAGSSSSISQVATNPSSSNSSGASQSSSLSVSLSPKDDSFVKRLIEAVKEQPCLYNPNHEHYGNKHSSVQYKSRIWQKLCHDLGYTEDAHSLQIQWKRIRDRYVRERRKRRNAINTDINANQVSFLQF